MKLEGRIKAGEGTLIGNAGEYYVVAELLKRGVVAALAPRNAPGFDVLATNGRLTARIRVKTKSEQYDLWRWVVKPDGTIFRDLMEVGDFTVLVNLTQRTGDLAFFVVPTTVLHTMIVAEFDEWLSTPGRNGQQHDPNNRVRGFGYHGHAEMLEPYRDAWELLWGVG
jgi:hypothetical protein